MGEFTTTDGVRVRRATVDDAGPIADVHVRSWKAAYVSQIPDDFLAGLSADQREPMWHQIIESMNWPQSGALVLEADGAVAGFAHIAPNHDPDGGAHDDKVGDGAPGAASSTGEITSIYLAPEHWGRGWGRMLMDRALAEMRAAGFTSATLWVLGSNQRARRFYEAGGWTADGTEKSDGHWGFGLLELRYRMRL